MKILTAEQMRDVDRLTSERYGVPSLQLMENAGAAIVDYLLNADPDLNMLRVLVLCGKGNNGGDGLVVARLLRDHDVAERLLLFADPSEVHGDAAVNLQRWQSAGSVQVICSKAEWEAARSVLQESDLVIDALLGTGLKGAVEGLLAAVIDDLNAAAGEPGGAPGTSRRLEVVSVDMPSGLSSEATDLGGPVVRADVTVTLTAPKVGQMVNPRADCVGKLVVREIGTPPALLEDDARLKLHWLDPGEFRDLPMVRKRDSNKGTFGHALVVAGSFGKSGAAAMAGRAALRVGAGLVTVATPPSVLPIVAGSMLELMTAPLAAGASGAIHMQAREQLKELERGKSVLALGPGLTTQPETKEFVQATVASTELPIILDADGLNAFDGHAELLSARKSPLLAVTPHPGEMSRLIGLGTKEVQARRLEVALDAAARWRAYVILKGFHTILATPDGRAFVNTTGNPGMATGGTGDVLTGMLAGLTAEFGTAHWERVLGLGIYLHGLAGDLAAARVGEAPLVATDLIEALPGAFANFLAEWQRVRN